MAAMEKKLDMLVKAMTNHSSAPIQQVTQVELCAICSDRCQILRFDPP
jgi:hypothetical protein